MDGGAGQQKDIGPGVSHRGVAIRHWIDGDDTPEVARKINDSLAAVERYIQAFACVVFLGQHKFDCFATALTMPPSAIWEIATAMVLEWVST